MGKQYCMDCDHYVAGGGEYNCRAANIKYNQQHVCALKEACPYFEARQEREKLIFEPIKMRKAVLRRRRC